MNQPENTNRTFEILEDLELELENLEEAIKEWDDKKFEVYPSVQRRLVLANNRLAVLVVKYRR